VRKRPEAVKWLNGMTPAPKISGIAALEVLYGAHDATEQRTVEAWLNTFPIVWPTDADFRTAWLLAPYRLSAGVQLTDSITAAIAMRQRLRQATFNVKHFRAIPGLSTAQPYIRS
jgi:predicted nucleic acid-binding protein